MLHHHDAVQASSVVLCPATRHKPIRHYGVAENGERATPRTAVLISYRVNVSRTGLSKREA